MVKERFKRLTRATVFQIGLAVLALGAIGYEGFRLIGFDGASAGIAAEAVLVLVVFGWTGSYLRRVFTGKMTFVEQRKRYRKAYDELTKSELAAQFESMSEEEQIRLIEEMEDNKEALNPKTD